MPHTHATYGSLAIVKLLVERHKADRSLRTADGKTAAELALENGQQEIHDYRMNCDEADADAAALLNEFEAEEEAKVKLSRKKSKTNRGGATDGPRRQQQEQQQRQEQEHKQEPEQAQD